VNGRESEYEVQEILAERKNGTKTEYLVRWEGYEPEDDTWEPTSNLSNAKGVLRTFKAQGRATKGGRYHVTASVTEKIKREKEQTDEEGFDRTRPVQTRSDQIRPSAIEPRQFDEDRQVSQKGMTREPPRERDSGTAPMTQSDRGVLTGKLCKRVMVLIKWQCSTDTAVDACMVRALEEWLQRRGISIYTDLL
jgi:hypothetical protein